MYVYSVLYVISTRIYQDQIFQKYDKSELAWQYERYIRLFPTMNWHEPNQLWKDRIVVSNRLFLSNHERWQILMWYWYSYYKIFKLQLLKFLYNFVWNEGGGKRTPTNIGEHKRKNNVFWINKAFRKNEVWNKIFEILIWILKIIKCAT